ncbi:Asp-tRNA(Asn)/Glu-tRNA(Gln) amidotransferase GatCAB subunit B [candidate division WWE3 bacterium CG_4_10_14_0_2_um_filter_41_14]|uniref:Aspartyl/glutamyl-tRNA(Asn/Gln) amidotransferase subunit B n=1 Tax=candidate division WWE3 bacterium CG_4_10_14_0_2_um_filter_41_14 TaxID=1975072 RepID=A0A2M7THK7_UNCKA|nr:MAG: Asp-tRNA(Asn)/Glu-tRNA(Gln) amidotransferase GatCAB subunit B [candidate division WWE3 bacterium CG_4_10_14_0_2_um_filter_41_14]
MSNNSTYELIIGLEIHIQLNTESKMFGVGSNNIWKEEPNSHVAPVDLGLPGTLPVPNGKAIEFTQRCGHALHCNLATNSKFDRKNYFYPDLPKGYQISQYDQPFCTDGYLDIPIGNNETKRITIRRIHLEEDTGKSLHKDGKTYLDFNKAGVPLMELVTEPDFRTSAQASDFSKMIQVAVRVLGISDADMEKGNMRLEANVSVRKIGETTLPNYRVELKNINSFKFLRDAVEFEFTRQVDAQQKGERLYMETRGWDSKKGVSVLQRRKETESDYRYFPEPDIPPFVFDKIYFDEILADLPTMPWDLETQLVNQGVRSDYAQMLAYEEDKYRAYVQYKDTLDDEDLVKLIANTKDMSTIENEITKIKSQKNDVGVSADELSRLISMVIEKNPTVVLDYTSGKENALHFLVGQVMKLSQGRADATVVREHLIQNLRD